MGVATNCVLLIFTLFAANWVYAATRRKFSRIPYVTATWRDWLERKPQISIIQRAYDNYSQVSQSFTFEDLNIVPPSVFPEVRKLPSTVLHSSAANEDILLLARSLGSDYWDVIPFVRQMVVRSIPDQVLPVRNEVAIQMRRHFTSSAGDKIWASVPIWATTFTMMCSLSARFLVGEPLCNDDEFTKKIGSFTRGVGVEALFLRQVPSYLKPVVATMFLTKKKVRFLKEKMRPYVMDSLSETDDGQVILRDRQLSADDGLLHQFVAYVLPKYSDPAKTPAQMKEKVLDEVTGRYLGLFFAAIDTSTITFAQICLDLVGHPRSQYADVIRNEISTVLKKHNGQWNAEAVGELKYIDSFIHESQRLHPIGAALAARKVVAPGGHTFSNGDHFPQGAVIQLPIWYVHTDKSAYRDAHNFDGFRFVNDKHPEAAPSDIFMSFGHGHHACPGRRFALMTLKLMVVELLTNYEYEELSERPADILFGHAILPDIKKEIKIRPVVWT